MSSYEEVKELTFNTLVEKYGVSLTKLEASEVLKISKSTIESMIRTGRIEYQRIGRDIRIHAMTLSKMLSA